MRIQKWEAVNDWKDAGFSRADRESINVHAGAMECARASD